MLNKFISLALVICICFSLAACGEKDNKKSSASIDAKSQTAAASVSADSVANESLQSKTSSNASDRVVSSSGKSSNSSNSSVSNSEAFSSASVESITNAKEKIIYPHGPYSGELNLKVRSYFPEYEYVTKLRGYVENGATILKNMKELSDFFINTDEKNYKKGYYNTVLRAARERNYIFDIKYKGKIISERISILYELERYGIGYNLNFDGLNGLEGSLQVFFLRDDWVEDAKKRPYMYDVGKLKSESIYTDEDISEIETRKKILNIGGTETATYLIGLNYEDGSKDVDKEIVFVYDNFLFRLKNLKASTADAYEIVENLTFEKVYLEE